MPIGAMLLLLVGLALIVFAIHKIPGIPAQWLGIINAVAIIAAVYAMLKMSGLLEWIMGLRL